ncbi:hypothetical protein ACHAXN_004126 [Cyclotella atomus]
MNASPRVQRPKKKKRLWQLSRSSTKADAVTVVSMATRVQIAQKQRVSITASATTAIRKGIRKRTAIKAKTAINEIDEDNKLVDESIAKLGFVGKDPASKQVTFKNVELDQVETAMLCTIDGAKYLSFTMDTMFGDSGASCHIVNSDNGMDQVEQIHESIGSIGSDVKATKKGKLQSLSSKPMERVLSKYCK